MSGWNLKPSVLEKDGFLGLSALSQARQLPTPLWQPDKQPADPPMRAKAVAKLYLYTYERKL